jgi:hypothetical protein
MKEYTYTTEQISPNDFVMRCYDTTDTKYCTTHNQVHTRLYQNTTKEDAQAEYRVFIQNTMLF